MFAFSPKLVGVFCVVFFLMLALPSRSQAPTDVLTRWNTLNSLYNQWIPDVDLQLDANPRGVPVALASFDRLSAAVQSLTQMP
jgi:hypothetical protein